MLSAILSNRHPPPPPDLQETAQDATENAAPSVETNQSRHFKSRPLVPRNSLWASSPPLRALPNPIEKPGRLGYTHKTSYRQFRYRQLAKRLHGSMNLDDNTLQALVRRASEPEWNHHPKGRRNQNGPIVRPTPGGPVGRSDSCGPTMTAPAPKLKKRPSKKYPSIINDVVPPTPKIPKLIAQVESSKPDRVSESLEELEKYQRAVRDQPTRMLLQKKSKDSLRDSVTSTRTVRIITTQTHNFSTTTLLVEAPDANNTSDINRKKLNRRSKSFDQPNPHDITPRSTSRGRATVPLTAPRNSASLLPLVPGSNVSIVYTPPSMSCSSWMPLALAPVELADDLFLPSQGEYPATLIPPMFFYTPSRPPHTVTTQMASVSSKTLSIQPKKSFHQLLFGKKSKPVDPAVEEKYIGVNKINKKQLWTPPKMPKQLTTADVS